MDLFDEYRVIDVDTHVTEPADTWTSRVPARFKERAPRIERIEGVDIWVIDGKPTLGPGLVTMAGYDGRPPDQFPPTSSAVACVTASRSSTSSPSRAASAGFPA
jgi:hypothetical protein